MIKKNSVSLIIPINSDEIRVLLRYKKLLRGTLSYLSSYKKFCVLDDKKNFLNLLARYNYPHPKTFKGIIFNKKLVIKPRCGSSSKGIVFIKKSTLRLKPYLERGLKMRKLLIQEFISGEGFGFSGFFKNGKILESYAHKRVAEFPSTGGSSVIREKASKADYFKLKNLVKKVLKQVPWSGFAMFEFKKTNKGKFVFLECNPRIWGSIHQGLANGVNYFKPILGPTFVKTENKTSDCSTELFPLSLCSKIGYLFQGKITKILSISKKYANSKQDVCLFSDPNGFLSLCLRFIKKI